MCYCIVTLFFEFDDRDKFIIYAKSNYSLPTNWVSTFLKKKTHTNCVDVGKCKVINWVCVILTLLSYGSEEKTHTHAIKLRSLSVSFKMN